jgi:hypothetical protein
MTGAHPESNDTGNEAVPAILEPIGETTDEELLRWLRTSNVTDAEILAPRYITATIPAHLMSAAQSIARVSTKTRKQMRR